MEPNIEEVAGRIRALREDMGLTMQEMADATGRSVSEYAAQESGEQDLSFTFLYKCAQRLGVDVKTLSGILGHTRSAFTLDTYTHTTGDMQRRAAEIVETFLTDIFGEELRPWEESARAVREPSA